MPDQNQKWFALAGALLALIGVAAGAFGAHILKQKLTDHYLSIFEVAVRYQMYHALVLFVVAWALTHFPQPTTIFAGWAFIAGTLIFSGSLYLLALTKVTLWGAITPIGGVLFLIGWVLLAIGIFK